jgi:energy-converting hydrogenase A subunit M
MSPPHTGDVMQQIFPVAPAGPARPVLNRRQNTDRMVADRLATARELGLSNLEDVFFFALNSVALSDFWHEHPQARRCIERCRREAVRLSTLMEELPRGVLEEIRYHGAGRC